jgi:hypothetical protein
MYRMKASATRFIALLALLGTGCGGAPDYLLIGSARAPSADGMVEVEELDGGTALVTVHMERLPPPRHLGEGNTVYLVWFEAENGKTVKAGELDYKVETRTADLIKTCPFKKFGLKITAEPGANTERPGDFVVAEQHISLE